MMRKLIFYFYLLTLVLLTSCGPDYKVTEHLKEVPDGYACKSTNNGVV